MPVDFFFKEKNAFKKYKVKKSRRHFVTELISQDLYCTVVELFPRMDVRHSVAWNVAPHHAMNSLHFDRDILLNGNQTILQQTTITLLTYCFFFFLIYDVLIFVHLHIPEGGVAAPLWKGYKGIKQFVL